MPRGRPTKRKMSLDTEMSTPPKKPKLDPNLLTPTSKVEVVKFEAFLCNGKTIEKTSDLGDQDVVNIWTKALKLDWDDVKGCKHKKIENVIKVTYQLADPTTIRAIINDPEFTYERQALKGPETFTIRVLGLNTIREAKIGEIVKINARGTMFEVKPAQILRWMEKFGDVIGDYRYC